MASPLNVAFRAAESTDQEIAETLFGARQIVRGIHRAEDAIARHLLIERADEPGKPVLANLFVHLRVVNRHSG